MEGSIIHKGYVKFRRDFRFNDRSFKKNEIVSIDSIGLTREQFKELIIQKAVVWAATDTGVCYGPIQTRLK
jgi:hypothetical protein